MSRRLISSTILHRHGSRGPGASELSPFAPDNPINSQWKEEELEVLTSVGRSQIKVLGAWFATRYVLSGILDAGDEKTFWRSSKSDRALESAYDFVEGFNNAIGSEVVGPHPLQYDIDADNYFRPWKVFKAEANVIKEKIDTCENWQRKAEENKEFLQDIFSRVDSKPSVIQKPTKALWSTTYLHALREVETYWPSHESTRDNFSKALPAETKDAVTTLALWVWEQRFLHSGFVSEMGGRMSVDIVESALNKDINLNIFSGHDYTILSVLAALNLVDNFEQATGFGAYILFEVWESSSDEDSAKSTTVRIIFNPHPFQSNDGSIDMSTVNQSNEVLLKEISVSDLLAMVEALRESMTLFPPPKPLKLHGALSIDRTDSVDMGPGSPSVFKVKSELDLLS